MASHVSSTDNVAQAIQVEFAHQLQAKLKYIAVCIANSLSVNSYALAKTELALEAATVVIQESALYQSITLKSGAHSACQNTMDLIIQQNRVRDIHPMLILQAAPFLNPVMLGVAACSS